MAIPPGYAEASIRFGLTGMSRPSYLVFGLDPVSADPTATAAVVRAAFCKVGSISSKIDNQVTLGPWTVRIGQDGGEATVGIDAQLVTGGLSDTTSPPNVALLVHKRSGRGGRRGRGRMFIPWCVTEGQVNEAGILDASFVTAMSAACGVFLADLSSNQAPMVLLHEPGKTSPGAPDVVTSLTADPLVATQRRRLGR